MIEPLTAGIDLTTGRLPPGTFPAEAAERVIVTVSKLSDTEWVIVYAAGDCREVDGREWDALADLVDDAAMRTIGIPRGNNKELSHQGAA